MMSKKILLITLLFCGSYAFSQIDSSKIVNNELKVNAFYLLGGFPEISYERIIGDESAIGISIGFNIDRSNNFFELNNDFKLTVLPYYRLYFGKKRAAGFFIEANSVVFLEESFNSNIETGLGLGLSIGGKFLTKNRWIGELVVGGSRNFIDSFSISGIYPRLGLIIGKQF